MRSSQTNLEASNILGLPDPEEALGVCSRLGKVCDARSELTLN